MTLRQQWTVVGVAVAVLSTAGIAINHFVGREFALVSIGSRAPNFRAQTVDAPIRQRTLADYRGKVVLLNVWATWCAPCRVEMPSIQNLQRAYGSQGLQIVAVSIDTLATDADIRAFAQRHGLSFEILRDSTHAIQTEYQTTGVPETFVIARDGVIRKKVIGADDWESPGNRALIAQLLREPAS